MLIYMLDSNIMIYGIKATAHYGDIRADLERKGLSLGVNDLHIAGIIDANFL